jgi:hypothetical protein
MRHPEVGLFVVTLTCNPVGDMGICLTAFSQRALSSIARHGNGLGRTDSAAVRRIYGKSDPQWQFVKVD